MDLDSAMNARQALIESLAILAAPADAQIAWLANRGTGSIADELALDFDDWFRLLPELVELRVVSITANRTLTEVATALDNIPKNNWTNSDLTDEPAWERVRRSAGLALVALLEFSPERPTAYVHAIS